MSTLKDKVVVVTRPRSQSDSLRRRLESEGARVIEVPAIRFAPLDDSDEWERILARRGIFTDVLFTSRVAVEVFTEFCARHGVELSDWKTSARIGALGARTAERLGEIGLTADFVGKGKGAAAFAEEFLSASANPAGLRVLLPQSDIARPELRDRLIAAGVAVETVAVYSTRTEHDSCAQALLRHLDRGAPVHAVTFASPSAVRGFLEITGERGGALLRSETTRVVTIGPTTSQAVADAALAVDAEATEASDDGWLEALSQLF